MAVDFKTFIQIAPIVAAQDGNAGFPILLRGRHGVGKSQVVYQTAERLGLPVIERRASQMTEGDLVGLPSTDGDTTSFNPPDWFAQACREPVALFLRYGSNATGWVNVNAQRPISLSPSSLARRRACQFNRAKRPKIRPKIAQ